MVGSVKLLARSHNVQEITVNEGKVIPRAQDGTFHVEGERAKVLRQSGDFVLVGTNFRSAKTYRCMTCGFAAVFRDHCGKCGGSDLEPEED